MSVPDLSDYEFARTVADSPVWGVPVPGLLASFFRRTLDDRVSTVGLYAYQGAPVFIAWGYADERHCRFHAFRAPGGEWEQPRSGCPRVRAMRDGERVTGLLLRTRGGDRLLPDPDMPPPVAFATDSGFSALAGVPR
jgi:hypothetical protein